MPAVAGRTLRLRSVEIPVRKSKSPPSFAKNAKEEWGTLKFHSSLVGPQVNGY